MKTRADNCGQKQEIFFANRRYSAARQIWRYAARGDADDVSLLAFMDALLVAPCDTAADALAVTAWAEGLIIEVMLKLQAGDANPDLANVAATAVLLCRKAIGALEKGSGLAVEGFGGAVSRPN